MRLITDNDSRRHAGNGRGMGLEMKRINALNLEPTLPKSDDNLRKPRNQHREAPVARGTSKQEFQQALEKISMQVAAKQLKEPDAAPIPSQNHGQGTCVENRSAVESVALAAQQREAGVTQEQQQMMSNMRGNRVPGNTQAKDVSMSIQADKPAPGACSTVGAAVGSSSTQGSQGLKPQPSAPEFSIQRSTTCKTSLGQILNQFLEAAMETNGASAEPEWPDAQGPSSNTVLGRPQTGAPQMMQYTQLQPGTDGHQVSQPGLGQMSSNLRHKMQGTELGQQVIPQPQTLQGGSQGYAMATPPNTASGSQQCVSSVPGRPLQQGQFGQGQPGSYRGNMPTQQVQQSDVDHQGNMFRQPGQPVMMAGQMYPQQGMQNSVAYNMGNMQRMPAFQGPGGNGMVTPQMMMAFDNSGQQGAFLPQGFIPQEAPTQQYQQWGARGCWNSGC